MKTLIHFNILNPKVLNGHIFINKTQVDMGLKLKIVPDS